MSRLDAKKKGGGARLDTAHCSVRLGALSASSRRLRTGLRRSSPGERRGVRCVVDGQVRRGPDSVLVGRCRRLVRGNRFVFDWDPGRPKGTGGRTFEAARRAGGRLRIEQSRSASSAGDAGVDELTVLWWRRRPRSSKRICAAKPGAIRGGEDSKRLASLRSGGSSSPRAVPRSAPGHRRASSRRPGRSAWAVDAARNRAPKRSSQRMAIRPHTVRARGRLRPSPRTSLASTPPSQVFQRTVRAAGRREHRSPSGREPAPRRVRRSPPSRPSGRTQAAGRPRTADP